MWFFEMLGRATVDGVLGGLSVLGLLALLYVCDPPEEW